MEKIKALIKKLWDFTFKTEQGLYLLFGGLTTLVSIVTFGLFDWIFAGEHYNISTVISNIAGIIFAYLQRIYVLRVKTLLKKQNRRSNPVFCHKNRNAVS
jgi:putative flippase GtrA